MLHEGREVLCDDDLAAGARDERLSWPSQNQGFHRAFPTPPPRRCGTVARPALCSQKP